MFSLKKLIGCSTFGVIAGTAYRLKSNDYDVNSLGEVRLCRSAKAVFDVALIYKSNLYYKEWDKSSKEYFQEKKKVHKLAAEKLLELCCKNKGTYIKIGQYIASLEYLVPSEYVEVMKILHSKAPENSIEDVYKVLKQDLNADPSELFLTFDPKPIGTASIAQVHRATLKDGSEVAVKVQHSHIRKNVRFDLITAEILYKIMSFIFPECKLQRVVDEAKRSLPIELDFQNEGRNAGKIQQMFHDTPWLKIPKIYWELSSDRVLTMEYVEGGQVNDLNYIKKNKIDPNEVSQKIGLLYSQMIFTHGFIHADPHPGNILVRKSCTGNTEIVLLDHGLYATISDSFRYAYTNLWLSILRVDKQGMKYYSEKLGIKSNGENTKMYGFLVCMITGRPWGAISAGITNLKGDVDETKLLQNSVARYISKITDILETVDRQMLLIFKTNDLIRGIETSLKVQRQMTAYYSISKYCIKSVSQQKMRKAETILDLYSKIFEANWAIFKLNLYFLYIKLLQYSLTRFKIICAQS